ncbi:MAG: EamA family transporter [Lautropia sp.]
MTARAPIAPWLGVLLLMAIATTFATNHVAARLAFDHGTSVATAVTVRSFVTTFTVLGLLRLTRTPLALPAATVRRAIVIGLLLAVQSYCLYAAVARLPVALALLTFNVFPIMLAAVSWLAGGAPPSRRTLLAMPVILAGLVLALDVFGLSAPAAAAAGTGAASPAAMSLAAAPPVAAAGGAGGALSALARRWLEIGAGVGFGLTAAAAFAVALYLTTRWLGHIDGRLRACLTMATVGVVVLLSGLLAGLSGWLGDAAGPTTAFRFPNDTTGWVGLALLSLLYTTAFTSLFVVLPRLGAVNSAPAMNFEPIAAMILGAAVLGQSVGTSQIIGALLVIGGIVFLATGRST